MVGRPSRFSITTSICRVLKKIRRIASPRAARFRNRRPGLVTCVAKSTVPLVHVEQFGFAVAIARGQGVDLRIHVPAYDDQIEPTVIVEIDKRIAPFHPADRRQGDARLIRNVVKLPVAVVAIQGVVVIGEMRDVERWAPIVQVIADGDSHRKPVRCRPRSAPSPTRDQCLRTCLCPCSCRDSWVWNR